MAKRRRKARRKQGPPTDEQGGSPSSDPESDADLAQHQKDPLALLAWGKAAGSSEEGDERARFERAWTAFGSGDFRFCRAEAVLLASEATNGEVRRRALDLVDRMRVDPLALGMAAGALALVLMAVVWTFA